MTQLESGFYPSHQHRLASGSLAEISEILRRTQVEWEKITDQMVATVEIYQKVTEASIGQCEFVVKFKGNCKA